MKQVLHYLSNNPKLLKDFKKVLLKEKNKPSTTSCCSGSYITKYACWESFLQLNRTILFFEWSDVNGSKKFFKSVQEFYDFLEEAKIEFPDYNLRQVFQNNDFIYVTCVTGKNKLVCAASKPELESELKKANEAKPTTTNPYHYPYGDYDGYEGCWD